MYSLHILVFASSLHVTIVKQHSHGKHLSCAVHLHSILEFATAVWFWVQSTQQPQVEQQGSRFSSLGPPKAEAATFDILDNPELLWVDVPLDPSHEEVSKYGCCTGIIIIYH